ncbi:MAG: pyridoxamine 5'-phosphate oxidase family protein [Oscillospiraceae bacterium]|jgi:nitroimidazol reductase NimA-like FMN-containing flavoprotein (pyridoxamine 5'-phosphate oxidase superfamily)|nr:pyridoxamine 5'-phosphate oxidase family protein [Oscillospiraceae bacterium]
MQNRMKKYPLDENKIAALLERAHCGALSTLHTNGSPYTIPVHFVYMGGAVFIHCRPQGTKTDNIAADARVSFCVYEMNGYQKDPDGAPCDTNTEYESVVIAGTAELINDFEEKNTVLRAVVKKYTPELADCELPEKMVCGTGVIKIMPTKITGKYYS